MANWPATLPEFSTPMDITPQEDLIRTQMSTGPEKVRRRFTAASLYFGTTLQLIGSERDTLMSFYDSNISFTMVDPVSGASRTFRFRASPKSILVRGDSDPDKRLYNVQLQVERLP